MDIWEIGAGNDGARLQMYFGDDTTTSAAEICDVKIKGQDPEGNFEDTLWEGNTGNSGGALAAARWDTLPPVRLSNRIGPDGIVTINAIANIAADTIESEESDWFIPVTFYPIGGGPRYFRMLTKYDFTGFGTPAADTVDIPLSITAYTQIAYFIVPKRYEMALGWDV